MNKNGGIIRTNKNIYMLGDDTNDDVILIFISEARKGHAV